MAAIAKGFVRLPHGHVHYRYGGRGPVVVLLHDAPRSSILHLPNLEWLGEHYTVLALDIPGYGNSTPLSGERPTIDDYSRALAEALTALGIERCGLYGHHTSAKIALRFALDHPGRAVVTLLDGLALPDQEPDEAFLRRYLEQSAPAADGAHLASLWSRILDSYRYFPWFERSARTRLTVPLPDEAVLHEHATDVLMAGSGWTSAYAAAQRFAAVTAIPSLRSPVVFMCREDDVLCSHLERLPDPLPRGSRVERIAPDTASWRVSTLEALRRAELPDAQWSPPPASAPRQGGELQRYVGLLHGQMRVRLYGDGGTPVLMLHEVPGSSAELRDLSMRLGSDRLVVAPDLPGLGESHPLPYPSLGTYVSALGELVEELGLRAADVVAHGLSTPFAIALAAHRPGLVRRLALDAVPWVRSRDRGRLLRGYCPAIRPDRHGAYLQQIWQQLRDTEMSWPWFDRAPAAARHRDPDLDPERMQSVLVDIMKRLPSYGDAARAALAAAVRELLAAVRQPVLLFNDPADVRYRGTSRALKRLANGSELPRPASAAQRTALLRGFLD